MRDDIRAAIESARSVHRDGRLMRPVQPMRSWSFEAVRSITLAVLRELPDDLSVGEIRDELEIANNQVERL